jgi:hypothetical protein
VILRARPERGDVLAAGRVAAVEQDHVGIFGENLVERGPDAVVILVGGPEVNAMRVPVGQHRFGFRTALGGKEVAAVDHGWRSGCDG